MLAAGLAVASPAAANDPEDGTTGPSGAAGAAATVAAGGLSAFFAPSTVCATGAAQPFTLTVTVTSLPASKALRTLFITVPTGYAVSGVTASVGTPSVLTGTPAYIRVGGLNLSTTPGSNSVTVKFSSTTPAGGPTNWGLEGETGTDRRPDNDTATPNGDDFTAANLPTTTVALGCHVVFTLQPADAGAGQNITSVPLTISGANVTVEVHDGGDKLVTLATTINLTLNPVAPDVLNATLTGGSANATAGVASFTAIQVNNPGRYTVTAAATTPGITGAMSNVGGSPAWFRIWGAVSPCSGSCGAGVSSGSENFNVGAQSGTGAIGASVGVLPFTFDCSDPLFGGVKGIDGTDTVTWTSYNLTTGKTITFVIPNTVLAAASDPLLAIHYMVCVSAPYAFKTAWTPTGTPTASPDSQVSAVMGGAWFRGLLPDCQDVGGAISGNPCVMSRVNDGTKLTVTVAAGPGDPHGR
jgi:hypothetical protein